MGAPTESLAQGGPSRIGRAISRRQALSTLAALGVSGASLSLLRSCGTPLVAAPAKPLPRVGYVGSNKPDQPEPADRPYLDEFRAGLRELGYVEGQNVILEARFAYGQSERVPEMLDELVRMPVDVLVLSDTALIRPASQATSTIPIVMALSTDPVRGGYAESFARPGGNMTGLRMGSIEMFGKRLEWLQYAIPGIQRVGILNNGQDRIGGGAAWDQIRQSAADLHLDLAWLTVDGRDEADQMFDRIAQAEVQGILAVLDPVLAPYRTRLAKHAITHGLPMIGINKEDAFAGFLMALSTRYPVLFRRAAVYVDKIIAGAQAGELPIELARDVDFVINLATMDSLGITIPTAVRTQATEVTRTRP